MTFSFDAFVTTALFDRTGRAAFALGDGTIRFEGGEVAAAHDGAVLAACLAPAGDAILTGGDDGRVMISTASGVTEIARVAGRWIDAVAASSESKLIAFSAGRDLHVRDMADPAFTRTFAHEKSIADVAFDPKGDLWISTGRDGQLLQLDRNGAVRRAAGNGSGIGAGQFIEATYLAWDKSGAVYSGDTSVGRVTKMVMQ